MTTTTSARPPTPAATQPTAPEQRIHIIDILRGFALLGILLVNMQLFNHTLFEFTLGLEARTTLDQIGKSLIAFFAEGKFYSLFSFLFGLGMALQWQKAQERGQRFVPFFLRRMLVLFVIGLLHAYFIWTGDILTLYAVLGVVLLLFRNRSPRALLIWIVIILLVPMLLNAGLWGLLELGKLTPEGAEVISQTMAEQERNVRATIVEMDRLYATGSFGEIVGARAREMQYYLTIVPFLGFNVLAMFLLGLYAGKRRIFQNLPEHLPLIRGVALWGLILGVLGNGLYVYLVDQGSRATPTWQTVGAVVAQTIGAPALMLFYAAGLTLLAQRPGWGGRLQLLAPVGRMALTNYLLQSLICSTLFYGYGFGQYGRVGFAAGILLTIVIFLLQIPFSHWWLNRFRFGPMEWLWRSLSYGKRQPLRKHEAAASTGP